MCLGGGIPTSDGIDLCMHPCGDFDELMGQFAKV